MLKLALSMLNFMEILEVSSVITLFFKKEKDVIDEVNTFQRHTANSYMVSQIYEANH